MKATNGKVQVYKNLHRGDWSVRKGGKVVAHEREVWLADCSFHVAARARERVVRTKCREVHAWAIGELTEGHGVAASVASGRAFTYNPYRCATFTFRDTGEPVTCARYVHFQANGGAIAYV